jgi:transposase
VLPTQQASWVQRLQKALAKMNIQLTELISDVMGQTSQAVIHAIVAGERELKVPARRPHRRVKASEQDIVRALTGNWREPHLLVRGQALAMYDDIAAHLRECDAKLGALLAERSDASVDIGKTPRPRSKARAEHEVRQQLTRWADADLTHSDGPRLDSVMKIPSEIGTNLSRFANVKHFCPWLGPCPATKISGGMVLSARTQRSANRARQALKMAAVSLSHRSSALGRSAEGCAVAQASHAPIQQRRTSWRGWCTSGSPVARNSLTKANSAMKNCNANAAQPRSSAAQQPRVPRHSARACARVRC